MKLVINTNRIIAALIKDSVSRKIINHIDSELMFISFSEEELDKYETPPVIDTAVSCTRLLENP